MDDVVAQFEDAPPSLIAVEEDNVGTSTLKGVSKSGHGNGKVKVGEGPASGVMSVIFLAPLFQHR